jgi:hypothetical protein
MLSVKFWHSLFMEPYGTTKQIAWKHEAKEKTMESTATLPGASVAHIFGSSAGSGSAGAGMGLGGLALGGIGGLVLGSMMGGNGGLFGGNNNTNGAEGALLALNGVAAVNDVGKEVLMSAGATQTAIAASNLATLQATNYLGANIQAQNTQSLIQNLNSFNQQNSVLASGFSENYRAQQESAGDIKAAISATAAQQAAIAAAQALQLQECCCKMQTQSLENTQRILDQNTSFRIQDLQIENSNLRQTQVLRDTSDAQTSIILRHLIPTVSTVRTV